MRDKLWLLGLSAASLTYLNGCNSCSGDKPYTPFGVASTLPPEPALLPAPPDSGAATPAAATSGGFATRKSLLAPPASKRFELPEGALDAPPGHSFVQVLPADYDGSGKPAALAWLASDPDAAKDAPPGELWYFPNGKPPARLLALPGFVPSGPSCALEPVLAQTGPHSATLDVSARCKDALIARAPERALIVVSPASARPALVTLRLAAAAPGESLDLHVDSSDQDQDGRDDVRVSVAVGGAGASEPASADLVWLDRPAGSSRSSEEPRTSLAAGSAKLAARAHQKHFTQTAERVGNFIRVAAALCAEGGVPRVLDGDGAPFRCGELTPFVDNLTTAAVHGALSQRDELGAFAAFAREGWYFGHISKLARGALERELIKSTAHVLISEAVLARAVPLQPKTPHYSPLWFENDGALLVHGMTGVTRVSADGSSEQAVDPDGGTPFWPLEVAGSTGLRLSGVAHACDRSELLVLLSDAAGAPQAPVVTPLLAARPASCGGRGAGPSVALAPLGFDGLAPALLIAGAASLSGDLKALSSLPALGTPRSPDGKLLVLPTALGLFVGGERRELWQLSKLKEHSDPSKLTDCVVQNDAKSVACVENGKVVRYLRP